MIDCLIYLLMANILASRTIWSSYTNRSSHCTFQTNFQRQKEVCYHQWCFSWSRTTHSESSTLINQIFRSFFLMSSRALISVVLTISSKHLKSHKWIRTWILSCVVCDQLALEHLKANVSTEYNELHLQDKCFSSHWSH